MKIRESQITDFSKVTVVIVNSLKITIFHRIFFWYFYRLQ